MMPARGMPDPATSDPATSDPVAPGRTAAGGRGDRCRPDTPADGAGAAEPTLTADNGRGR